MRPRKFSEPIYTRLPPEVMEIFEELREESGKSKSEFARELISDRLDALAIQRSETYLKSVLEGEDANGIE